MHIVMISDVEVTGGAAIAASRLANAFCEAGHRVTRLVNGRIASQQRWQSQSLLPSRVHTGMRRLIPLNRRDPWEETAAENRLRYALAALRPDVINMHNIHSAAWAGWSPRLVEVCAEYAPVVWTLHDMWSFTGRCIYSYDCRQFVTGCTATCPTAGEYPILAYDKIADAWENRRRFFLRNPEVVAVTPSHWLAGEARHGLWSNHSVQVIPNGLPLALYRPLDRADARKQLRIETDGPALLVAANDFNERRKGGHLFQEALSQVTLRPLTVIVMGAGELILNDPHVRVRHLGYVSDEEQKVQAYCAADAYVHAAPVDNLPNMVLESIACGTPVVGFTIGGVPDVVRPGHTGWLSQQVTGSGLAAAIDQALNALECGVNLRDSCRQVAISEYSDEIQAKNYAALFHDIFSRAAFPPSLSQVN